MIIAGTGHRPPKLGGYSSDVYENLTDCAYNWLKENKPAKVISGMALGWDQALAEAAIGLDIPVIAAIPCLNQEYKWPPASKEHYHEILADVDEIVRVSPLPYTPDCMQLRNQWMVDHADQILALWDGSSGGTANCIRYANAKKKPVINLWAKYALIRAR